MTNQELVKLFRNVAAALQIRQVNRFRIIAYEKAADAIEHLTSEVKDFWDDGKLEEIPGIGKTIASHLDELFRTGKVKHFEQIFKGLSSALFEFLLIPGIGPKKAYRLTSEFHLNDPKTAVSQLKKLAKDGKIALLEGFGEKSQAEILSAIETYERGQIKENRMPLPYADRLSQEIISYLAKHSAVERVDCLGSLRRKVATIGDIDLAVVTKQAQGVIKYFVHFPKVRKIIDQGSKGATVLLNIGVQVDLRVQSPDSYGAMLQYFTGSKHHNIHLREFALKKGKSLSEHGIKSVKTGELTKYKTEEEFYKSLGLLWIPPELREDAGEIEAAQDKNLPKLIESASIKGDLHIHSDYDLESSHDLGVSSLEELLNLAAELKYEYIGISDHNPSASKHSESETVQIMKARREKLEHIYYSWQKKTGKRVHLLIMLEVDITPSGQLALPEAAFEFIDACIVSVHSSFNMSQKQMTQRILTGFSHPKARILGHPTGRLLGEREGYEVDWQEIFAYAAKHKKALEINSWPSRLDLPDRLVREAGKQGVNFVINTDAHAKEHLLNMPYGVDVARRGWATVKQILNTLSYNEFSKWLKN